MDSNSSTEDLSKLATIELSDGIAVISISNPPVNALSRDLRAAIISAVTEVSQDDRTEAVVLRGRNGAFIAGADLREFGKPLTAPTLPDVIEVIESSPKVIVAAIEGAALGGGFEIALACDGRIATKAAVVGLPEGTFGIIPGAGGTARLPRVTDAVTALEIISSCRQVQTPEAKELGLIDAVADDIVADAAAFARSLGGRKRRLRDEAPKAFDPNAFDTAVQTTLRRGRGRPFVYEQTQAIWDAVTKPFDEALARSRATFESLRDSDESAALRHLFFAEREAARMDDLSDIAPLRIGRVGIVGAGTMGSAITAAFLAAGFPVTLTDLMPEALSSAPERVAKLLAKVAKPAELTLADRVDDLEECDILLEAVFEDLSVKSELMSRFGRIAKPGAIFASNTSYLDLNVLAEATGRPQSVIGLHFFAPAHIMKLLEIVKGTKTSAQVLRTALALSKRLRKVAVVSGVGEGFIGNRIYNAYRAQCEALLMDGASPEQVDTAIEALGFAMGPFTVSDLSGLDIAWANRKRKQETSGEKGLDVPVLEWLVGSGRLGRKTGAGWYQYIDGQRASDPEVIALIEKARTLRSCSARTISTDEIQTRALTAIVNEALLVLEDKIASRGSDIDVVLTNGYGFPKHLGGPLFWAKRQPRKQLEENLAEIAAAGRRGNLALLDK
ncbi:3-hydroxyacyl-CoA dehydrogenase [bacterium M00.F.Ca.ET.194.01.1.1]|nr:3-hydroxyacyl-CoA dehydrogenase [bacterium M00.F.Ca.ET.194.01.1.1]TGS52183.1 3-hydroxyacyl-CoA dehydrogenase [bacterium M00.F.Ca.ET.179.01.1.1]TGV43331.1 3-hydroxyacyl-CoA dehydrogenase [bacterium M00.F.Ca.ET.168.01.1.1]